ECNEFVVVPFLLDLGRRSALGLELLRLIHQRLPLFFCLERERIRVIRTLLDIRRSGCLACSAGQCLDPSHLVLHTRLFDFATHFSFRLWLQSAAADCTVLFISSSFVFFSSSTKQSPPHRWTRRCTPIPIHLFF